MATIWRLGQGTFATLLIKLFHEPRYIKLLLWITLFTIISLWVAFEVFDLISYFEGLLAN